MKEYLRRLIATARTQRLLPVFLLAVFAAVAVQYTLKITDGDNNRSAFLRWRQQILDLGRGVNIYDEHNYPNPPIMALLLRPLAELPPVTGALAWFFLKAVMALLVFHWVFRLVEDPGRPFPAWAKALAAAVSLRPILGDLTHGNVNIFILFLLVAALYSFRGRRDFAAGLLLALAIACKVTPALFVPYLLWKRAGVALAGCAAGLVLFLWAIPAGILGADYNAQLLDEWADRMIVPYLVEGRVTSEHQNQSLPGLAHRLLAGGASFSTCVGEEYVPIAYHNLADLPPQIVGLLLKAAMLTFAAFVVWCCRTPTGERRSSALAVEYSLIVLGMLLFSERTWKHHYVTLVLPVAALLYALTGSIALPGAPPPGRRRLPRSTASATGPAAGQLSRGLRLTLVGALVGALVCMSATSTGVFGETADRFGKLAQVYGAYVWANLLLCGAMVLLLRSAGKRPADATSGSHILAVRVPFGRPLDKGVARPVSPCTPRANPLHCHFAPEIPKSDLSRATPPHELRPRQPADRPE